MKTFKIHIAGKVQGVWYRASAKDKAISLGIKGKIWNATDGSVEAIAQGPVNKIFEFIEWCKQGPPLSRVEDVKYHEVPGDVSEYSGFEISRA